MSNDLTIPPEQQSQGLLPRYGAEALALELGKMLALVAPVTMSDDQQTAWLAAAVDSLQGIYADEVQAISLEIRRSVTRPSQIVPEIAKLVSERRRKRSDLARLDAEAEELKRLPPRRKHVADRDRSKFTAADWAELNEYLESQGSKVRYSPEGKKLAAA